MDQEGVVSCEVRSLSRFAFNTCATACCHQRHTARSTQLSRLETPCDNFEPRSSRRRGANLAAESLILAWQRTSRILRFRNLISNGKWSLHPSCSGSVTTWLDGDEVMLYQGTREEAMAASLCSLCTPS